MNTVNIIGRLGADPEIRHTPGGKAVASLNMAIDDGWGENKKTVWIGVTLWGATAELAGKALSKGDRVGITGRLSQEEWEKDGVKQRKTKVTAESMHLLSSRRADTPGTAAPANTPAPAPAPAPDQDYDDEQIPF
jgi:single-strand DNA-binding protein